MLDTKNSTVKSYLDLYETGKVFQSRENMLEHLTTDLCNQLEQHKESLALKSSEEYPVMSLSLLYLYSTLGKGGGGCRKS